MNTVTYHHQDGDMTFKVRWAWFMVSPENLLTLSIECEENNEFDYMSSPSFCLADFPLQKPLADGMVIRFAGNEDDSEQGPRAHEYVGIHQSPRDVIVQFNRVTKESCDVEISWSQDDPNYYGERAKENRVVGVCQLKRGQRKNMWLP